MAALSGRFVASCGDSREARREPKARLDRVDPPAGQSEPRGSERNSPDWRVSARSAGTGWPRESLRPAILTRTSPGTHSAGRASAQRVVTFRAYPALSQHLLEKC